MAAPARRWRPLRLLSVAVLVVVAAELLARGLDEPEDELHADRVGRERLALTSGAERALLAVDPELGWRLRPGRDLMLDGVRVRTNSLGLRGAEPVTPDVVCLGDSVAFGSGLEEAEAWPWLLAARSGAEVLVGAVPGYSSEQGRVLLADLLGRFRPRVVVLAFGLDDDRSFPVADWQWSPEAGGLDRLGRHSALVARLARRLGRGEALRRARQVLDLDDQSRLAFPPADAAEAAAFAERERQIEELLTGVPERVPLNRYADNLAAMIELARSRGAEPILLAPVSARPTLSPRFGAWRLGQALAAYREAMRATARREDAAFVTLPILNDGRGIPLGRLFLVRRVDAAERRGLELLGHPHEVLGERGYLPGLVAWVGVLHPSPVGHALVAETLTPLVAERLATVNGRAPARPDDARAAPPGPAPAARAGRR